MGVSTIGTNLHDLIPRRSSSSSSSVAKRRPRPSEVIPGVKKKKPQLRCITSWCFSLCPKYDTDARIANPSNNPPSLAQFLASERRAANGNHNFIYGPDGLALAQPVVEPNSLFVDGCVAPPRSGPLLGSGLMENGDNGCGVPFLLYCMCGQDIHWIDFCLNSISLFFVTIVLFLIHTQKRFCFYFIVENIRCCCPWVFGFFGHFILIQEKLAIISVAPNYLCNLYVNFKGTVLQNKALEP